MVLITETEIKKDETSKNQEKHHHNNFRNSNRVTDWNNLKGAKYKLHTDVYSIVDFAYRGKYNRHK